MADLKNLELAKELVEKGVAANIKLSLAESCTGGLIASYITSISGSSAVFDRGFVTYSNKSKVEMLGADSEIINKYGAVSHQVSKNMAEGALVNSNSDLAVSVTGIAGPTGGADDKPIGLVYIGLAAKDNDNIETNAEKHIFEGSRLEVREETVQKVLEKLLKTLDKD